MLSVGLVLLFASSALSVGEWGPWGAWSKVCTDCPVDAGSRGRTRVCVPGTDSSACSGARVEVESCCGESVWSDWGAYGDCTADCGNCGVIERNRTCETPAGCTPTVCVGDEVETDPTPCDSGVICKFPMANCCSGTKTMVRAEMTVKCL